MPKWPCPECGARKGHTHKTTCRHAQRTRWRIPDEHNPVVYKTRGSVQYLRCSRCHKPMGKRAKRLCLRGRALSAGLRKGIGGMMCEPKRREFAAARLRYERARLHAWWLLRTGRCPGCPKKRNGPHKFGCHKPGPMPSTRKIRLEQ